MGAVRLDQCFAGWNAHIYDAKIRENVAVVESQVKRVDIFRYNGESKSAQDYLAFVEEYLSVTQAKTIPQEEEVRELKPKEEKVEAHNQENVRKTTKEQPQGRQPRKVAKRIKVPKGNQNEEIGDWHKALVGKRKETRKVYSFRMRNKDHQKISAVAYFENMNLQAVMDKMIEEFIERYEKENGEIK